jgi:nitrate/TMAO reductase-like tetraheme cytochrome c subunit
MPKPGAAPGPLAAERLETARQRWPDTPPEAWAQARQLYLSKCADCHSYPDLAYYEAGEWPKIMERMGRKAKVTPAEAELLLRFVLASR